MILQAYCLKSNFKYGGKWANVGPTPPKPAPPPKGGKLGPENYSPESNNDIIVGVYQGPSTEDYNECSKLGRVGTPCGSPTGSGVNRCVRSTSLCQAEGAYDVENCGTCMKRKAKLTSISKCQKQSGGVCTMCNSGYVLANGNKGCNLIPISNCETQDDIYCKKCGSGYNLSNDKRKCFPPIGWCQEQNGLTCGKCVDGYELKNNACFKKTIPEQGEVGIRGLRGPPGIQGPRGLKGPRGAEGRPAEPGDKGWQGIQGPQGLVGPDGPHGQAGLLGLAGSRGLTGSRGQATIIDPWNNKNIISSLKNIYHKISNKNKEMANKKNPPINLNIKMGNLGGGDISSFQRSTETLGKSIQMDITDPDLNPAKKKRENLSMLEEFNSLDYVR